MSARMSLLIGMICGLVAGCGTATLVMSERHSNFVKAARGIRDSERALRQLGTPEERINELSEEFWEKAE